MDFERASTGLPGLDAVLDGLRLGDNVVWQVDSIEEYRHFAGVFAAAATATGRRLVYLRFGRHEPVVAGYEGMRRYELDAGRGFEHFSAAIREIAAAEGEGVFYIFDCLSELLSEWSTDLMIGNFFLVTCPYLFELRTIAYFALHRDQHSYQTIARIRDTTQLLLDVCRRERYYVHPLKVWQRYSPTMFLPHADCDGDFVPLTSSADAARLFALFPRNGLGNAERKLDYWDQMFLRAGELSRLIEAGDQSVLPEQAELREQLIRMVVGRDEKILDLARKYLQIDDLLPIRSRLIGSGYIGGKAAGFLLARKILAANGDHDWNAIMEPHDSFFIGSDVYYTYLVENDCWQLRLEQKKEEQYFSAAAALREKISGGKFPAVIRDQFLEMLGYFGQSPIIVRSSSLLEDGFGNAFAGMYESVFCANQGDLAARYDQFVAAVRRVYASTMDDNALAYRLQRGLAQSDEQMALLVQRVSGLHRGAYFFPDAAGVALAHNLYVWREGMDPAAGMLRLVVGLGTRAVDRVDDDYARFVALDHPRWLPDAGAEAGGAHTQHSVDLLDLGANQMRTVSAGELFAGGLIRRPALFAAKVTIAEGGKASYWRIDFNRLLATDFPLLMREMLQTLQKEYGQPVDTEFTLNLRGDGELCLNLLQCRPLQVKCNRTRVAWPADVPPDRVVFTAKGGYMGGNLTLRIDRLIYVDPEAYTALPISEKYRIARLIGAINQSLAPDGDGTTVLLGPGRWGTSTPSLGVPASFAEINHVAVLGEMAFSAGGLIPEISYGTHFFQDLVETGISYVALDERNRGARVDHALFASSPNRLVELVPEAGRWGEVIRVISAEDVGEIWVHAEVMGGRVLCWRR